MPALTPKQVTLLNKMTPGPARGGVNLGTLLQQILKNQQVKVEGFAGTAATGNALINNMDALVFNNNDTAANFIAAADTVNFYKGVGANKLKSLTTAAIGDKSYVTIGSVDWSASNRVGFWAFSDIALNAGDLRFYVYTGTAQYANVPAIPAGVYTWVEVDISAMTSLTTVTQYGFQRNKAAIFNVDIDHLARFNTAAISTLNQIPVGIVQLNQILTANTGTHTFTALVEDTDYILGANARHIIYLTNQSANSIMAYYSY